MRGARGSRPDRGRLHTIDLDGDTGRSRRLLDPPSHRQSAASRSSTSRLVRALAGNPLPTIGGYDVREARPLTRTEVDRNPRHADRAVPRCLGSLRDELPDGCHRAAERSRLVYRRPRTPGARRRIASDRRCAPMVEADAAAASRAPVAALDLERDRVRRRPVRRSPGRRIPIRASRRSPQASTSGRASAVESDRGRRAGRPGASRQRRHVEAARHVVVTVPLGVLKAGGLTSSRRCLRTDSMRSTALGFGRYEKVVLVFDTGLLARLRVVAPDVFPSADDLPADVDLRPRCVRRRTCASSPTSSTARHRASCDVAARLRPSIWVAAHDLARPSGIRVPSRSLSR